jgi:hypothetical protein
MNKIKVIVDRSKWKNSANKNPRIKNFPTYMYGPDGCKCILGFVCATIAGDKPEYIRSGSPEDMPVEIPELTLETPWNPLRPRRNTLLALEVMEINDGKDIPLDKKESLLKDLFDKTRYELVFVGEPL